jgi:hypothetical protein
MVDINVQVEMYGGGGYILWIGFVADMFKSAIHFNLIHFSADRFKSAICLISRYCGGLHLVINIYFMSCVCLAIMAPVRQFILVS